LGKSTCPPGQVQRLVRRSWPKLNVEAASTLNNEPVSVEELAHSPPTPVVLDSEIFQGVVGRGVVRKRATRDDKTALRAGVDYVNLDHTCSPQPPCILRSYICSHFEQELLPLSVEPLLGIDTVVVPGST